MVEFNLLLKGILCECAFLYELHVHLLHIQNNLISLIASILHGTFVAETRAKDMWRRLHYFFLEFHETLLTPASDIGTFLGSVFPNLKMAQKNRPLLFLFVFRPCGTLLVAEIRAKN
jgi:hypothetical protein